MSKRGTLNDDNITKVRTVELKHLVCDSACIKKYVKLITVDNVHSFNKNSKL